MMKALSIAVSSLLGLVSVYSLLFYLSQPARASGVVGNGTPQSCTEAAFDAALHGGGDISFDCGPLPYSLTLTGFKLITLDTQIDGAGLISITAVENSRMFSITTGAALTLTNLTLRDAKFRVTAVPISDAAVYN